MAELRGSMRGHRLRHRPDHRPDCGGAMNEKESKRIYKSLVEIKEECTGKPCSRCRFMMNRRCLFDEIPCNWELTREEDNVTERKGKEK